MSGQAEDQTGGDARGEERGRAPGGVALLVIDMLNPLDFGGGEKILSAAEAAADRVVALRAHADEAGVPVVYVNDNHDQWHSERSRIVEMCRAEGSLGRSLAEKLEPRRDDYFVIKPQFSGFYSTNLPVLLPRLGASRLVLTGVAADICILFTAADAHMREYGLWVPEDCTAAVDERRTRWALDIMRTSMKADTRPSTELSLADWVAAA